MGPQRLGRSVGVARGAFGSLGAPFCSNFCSIFGRFGGRSRAPTEKGRHVIRMRRAQWIEGLALPKRFEKRSKIGLSARRAETSEKNSVRDLPGSLFGCSGLPGSSPKGPGMPRGCPGGGPGESRGVLGCRPERTPDRPRSARTAPKTPRRSPGAILASFRVDFGSISVRFWGPLCRLCARIAFRLCLGACDCS